MRTLLVLSCGLLASTACLASNFDGTWSVRIIATSGACETMNWPIEISAGKVASVAGLPGDSKGGISPTGKVDITLTGGSDVLIATGAAKGVLASGKWTSPSKQCSGNWSASRS